MLSAAVLTVFFTRDRTMLFACRTIYTLTPLFLNKMFAVVHEVLPSTVQYGNGGKYVNITLFSLTQFFYW